MTQRFGGTGEPLNQHSSAARLSDISLRHLSAFLAVADMLSFTDAANRLSSNQPALTRSVQRIEEHMGLRLFHRTTRQVSITPAGEKLRDELQVLLPLFEKALRPESVVSELRLGFSWLLPDNWVHDAINRFEVETRVGVELKRRDDVGAGIAQSTLDVAILRGYTHRRGMRATRVGSEQYVAVVPHRHPLAARSGVDWSELAEHPLIVSEAVGPVTEQDWGAGPLRIALRCHNFDECIESAAAGKGLGVVPELALRRTIHPSVDFVPLRGGPQIPISLIQPVQGSHPLVGRFVQIAQDVLAPGHRPDFTAGRLRHTGTTAR
ncbi:LysR family transcriptional regulator [Streptomyces sp. NPDC050610]|uniref:LysR family transcriptional regulator n=1 Tax=Streptomyces sp. NPDC050610 TaxID=3157097 RepID=UPI00341223AB